MKLADFDAPLFRWVALPMAQPSQIEGRLRTILQNNRRRKTITGRMAAVSLVAVALVLLPLAALRPIARAASPRQTTVASAAKKKFVGYDFTWGAVPGHPEKAVAQMQTLYQWLAAYRGTHGSAYPVHLSDLMNDMQRAPQTYGFPAGRAISQAAFDKTLFNPDYRYTNLRSLGPTAIPYNLFDNRPDDTPIGGPKAPGERDVLASTAMYVQQNWKRGIPTTQTGFYLALWDDGQIEKIPWNKLLYVPYGEMAQRMGAGESPRAVIRSHSREIRNGPGYVLPFRQAFPGQPGLGTQALSWEEYHREI